MFESDQAGPLKKIYFHKTILILLLGTWQLVNMKQNKATYDPKFLNVISIEIVLVYSVLGMLSTISPSVRMSGALVPSSFGAHGD